MEDWREVLAELSDDPEEFDYSGGTAFFVRQGEEHMLDLRDVPGAGISVVGSDDSYSPIGTYIQRDILGLPRLATQISRTLSRAGESRPGRFVEGPARLIGESGEKEWGQALTDLHDYLLTPEPGTTRLIQLMAKAGQGKTVLLEKAAIQFAGEYQPDAHPMPLLLVVDLLGRYVGTIDDAIAGSLNNTYLFPGLTQRDVALCIRRRWLALALDGFDELVARVGSRDAFLRITELLDQLRESGTLILSARESFFELYQVSAAIRTYLQPKRGSYQTATVELLPWREEQGIRVFEGFDRPDPVSDIKALLGVFGDDPGIVLHPFFLTRLADLWVKGERFDDAGSHPDELTRTRYVIETFLERESREKWISADGQPLLPASGHAALLGGVAEEMWRSGAFSLDSDELRIAGELGVADLDLAEPILEGALDRLPTHAALMSKGRGSSFIHDRFLHYFLGHRLVKLLDQKDAEAVQRVLEARDLGPDVAMWVGHGWSSEERDLAGAIEFLNSLSPSLADEIGAANATLLMARLLDGRDLACELRGQVFVGDSLAGRSFRNLSFVRCRFWYADLQATAFADCRLLDCEFGDIRVNESTRLHGTRLQGCTHASVEVVGGRTAYSPEEIEQALVELGAEFAEEPVKQAPSARTIASSATDCVEQVVRMSERTCDVSTAEIEERWGKSGRWITRYATDTGVVRVVEKPTSGGRKQFVRFSVDREKLLRGQAGPTGTADIDTFWEKVRSRFPHKG